jgi:hypothetical protein
MALNHAILGIVHIDGKSPVFLDTVPIDETFSFEISIIHFCLEYRIRIIYCFETLIKYLETYRIHYGNDQIILLQTYILDFSYCMYLFLL